MAKANSNATVSNFTPLRQTMHASIEGRPARCIAYGDVAGNSPSYLVVDDRGQSAWFSISDVTIVDSNVLPVTREAHATLTGSSR